MNFKYILSLLSLLFVLNVQAENTYFTAQGEEEGKPVIYRSLTSVPEGEKESDYPTLLNIYWALEKDKNNGMPDAETSEKQIKFEDAVTPLDVSGTSHLMLVVTGNGRKEWIWYVKDAREWLGKLNELLVEHEVYPIEIEINQDPKWSTYHDFVAGVKGL